jgi:hypothetical protein
MKIGTGVTGFLRIGFAKADFQVIVEHPLCIRGDLYETCMFCRLPTPPAIATSGRALS